MVDRYDYWIHGASVQAENSDSRLGLKITRLGWRADVTQARDTWNWFHFAIPTPTYLDDDEVQHRDVTVIFKVNDHAKVDMIHVHEAKAAHWVNPQEYWAHPNDPDMVKASPVIKADDNLNIVGQAVRHTVNLPDVTVEGPLIISVRVHFVREGALITFFAAGGAFDEKT